MKKKNHYKVIGLMSGTSMDGLDIAYCQFFKTGSAWSFSIDHAVTVKYSSTWLDRLSTAHKLPGEALINLDHEFGKHLGKTVSKFVQKNKLEVDFISSHGHTVFHQPSKGFTLQIGNGHSIHSASGLPVIWDFRTLDVALGGEGAPLVPIGDKLLFNDYDVCLNLGGIANLSADLDKKRLAYDVCFCNMALNYLAEKAGKQFDVGGSLAAEGEVSDALLKEFQKKYKSFSKKRPSLGREIFEADFKSLLDKKSVSIPDRLRTFTESIAMELVKAISPVGDNVSVLCTGGGAFNSFLLSRMLEIGGDRISWIVPDEQIVKFKEALVFAFLGVLKHRGEINVLKSVTHGGVDSSSGLLTGF